MRTPAASLAPSRAGITLTEVLLGIMILGIGLVSLATLFPIGLLRLRAAQRLSRSTYLVESAAADVAARGLLNTNSFVYADLLNGGPPPLPVYAWWYAYPPNGGAAAVRYDPLTQDTPSYGGNPSLGASTPTSGGYGLPFAYDPLWRYQTDYVNGGIYLFDINNPDYNTTPGVTPEARFAAGDALRASRGNESDGNPPSAYGLQRLTNFNRPAYINAAGNRVRAVMPQAIQVPNIFVSPEDVVWQEPTNTNYWQAFTTVPAPGTVPAFPVGTPSPVVADLSISTDHAGNHTYQPVNDWRFSWMITAQQNNAGNGASFDGNIVIFENRAFALDQSTVAGTTIYQAAGETVVEGVFGYSKKVVGTPGYGAGADRTVLIRWDGSVPADPVVKVGDWIADVTYERVQSTVNSRFLNGTGTGVPNPLNSNEWDNLPAQRCFWYQVQKTTPAQVDPALGNPFRSMVVYVNRKLEARTLLDSTTGNPVYMNAVLICPNVVNVVPQTFFVR